MRGAGQGAAGRAQPPLECGTQGAGAGCRCPRLRRLGPPPPPSHLHAAPSSLLQVLGCSAIRDLGPSPDGVRVRILQPRVPPGSQHGRRAAAAPSPCAATTACHPTRWAWAWRLQLTRGCGPLRRIAGGRAGRVCGAPSVPSCRLWRLSAGFCGAGTCRFIMIYYQPGAPWFAPVPLDCMFCSPGVSASCRTEAHCTSVPCSPPATLPPAGAAA